MMDRIRIYFGRMLLATVLAGGIHAIPENSLAEETSTASEVDAIERAARLRETERRIKAIIQQRQEEMEMKGAAQKVETSSPTDSESFDPQRAERLREHELRIKEMLQKRREEAESRKTEQKEETSESPTNEQPLTVEAAANDSRIETITSMISAQIPGKVTVYGKALGTRVTVFADGIPVEEALSAITKPNGLVWWEDPDDGGYGISDKEYFNQKFLSGMVESKVFNLPEMDADAIHGLIEPLLTPGVGTVRTNDSSHTTVVYDLPEVLVSVDRILTDPALTTAKVSEVSCELSQLSPEKLKVILAATLGEDVEITVQEDKLILHGETARVENAVLLIHALDRPADELY